MFRFHNGLNQCLQSVLLTKLDLRARRQCYSVLSAQAGKIKASHSVAPNHAGFVDRTLSRDSGRDVERGPSDPLSDSLAGAFARKRQRERFELLASMGDYVALQDALAQVMSLTPPQLEYFHFNALIAAYSLHAMLFEALETFKKMIDSGIQPTRRTYNLLLQLAVSVGQYVLAAVLHREMTSLGFQPAGLALCRLVVAYSRLRQTQNTHALLYDRILYIAQGDKGTMRFLETTLRELATHGQFKTIIDLYEHAKLRRLSLSSACFHQVLQADWLLNKCDDMLSILDDMTNVFSVEPSLTHLAIAVSALSGHKRYDDIVLLLSRAKELKVELCPIIWRSIAFSVFRQLDDSLTRLAQVVAVFETHSPSLKVPLIFYSYAISACVSGDHPKALVWLLRHLRFSNLPIQPINSAELLDFLRRKHLFPQFLDIFPNIAPLRALESNSMFVSLLRLYSEMKDSSHICQLVNLWCDRLSVPSTSEARGASDRTIDELLEYTNMLNSSTVCEVVSALASVDHVPKIDQLWTMLIFQQNYVPTSKDYETLVSELCGCGHLMAAWRVIMQALEVASVVPAALTPVRLHAMVENLINASNSSDKAVAFLLPLDSHVQKVSDSQLSKCRAFLIPLRTHLSQKCRLQPNLFEVSDSRRIIYSVQNGLDIAPD